MRKWRRGYPAQRVESVGRHFEAARRPGGEEQRRWPNHGEVGSAPVSGQRRKKKMLWGGFVISKFPGVKL